MLCNKIQGIFMYGILKQEQILGKDNFVKFGF